MASADARAKLADLKAKRAQWMKERDAERVREEATQELRQEQQPVAGSSHSSGAADSSQYSGNNMPLSSRGSYDPDRYGSGRFDNIVSNGEVLDRITQRISERMREEVKAELEAEMENDQQVMERNRAKDENVLQNYLAEEIESHACPICYDVMLPPDRSPMLLFPCGHTFCEECLNRQKFTAYQHKCPYCKKKIESKAINFSLQQLIQAYVNKKEVIANARKKKTEPTPRSGGGEEVVTADMSKDEQISSYQKQYKTFDMRCRVLENEINDTRQEIDLCDQKAESATIVLTTLQQEEELVRSRLEDLKRELEFVSEQVTKQAAKCEAINTAKESALQRQVIVKETLAGLQRDRDKAAVILQGFGAQVPS